MMMADHLHQLLNSFAQDPHQTPHARFFSRQLCPYTHGFYAGDATGDKLGVKQGGMCKQCIKSRSYVDVYWLKHTEHCSQTEYA
jgi:hypothetical protein